MALSRKGRLLLFDCGEGTQMRMMHAGLKPTRIDAVFVTHLHGDHYFGLMGLVSTLSLLGREQPLTIVGPVGLAAAVLDQPGINARWLSFSIDFVELADTLRHEIVYEAEEYAVEARPIDHRTFTAGYRFQEAPKPGHLSVEKARALGVSDHTYYGALKRGETVTLADGTVVRPEQVIGPERPGRSFAYVTDTRPCENGRVLAREADLVYHDATFTDEHAKRAVETAHSTASEAAGVAARANARRLLIGHFSARHNDPARLLSEAQAVFKNTEVAEELKRYSL